VVIPNLYIFLGSSNPHVKHSILFVIYKALRADLNQRTAIGEAGAVPLLEEIAVAEDKRAASFASYMVQVINAAG